MIPVSLSGGVEPGARTGTRLGGREVVVWRDRDGAVRAWADRCPHRGLRLSLGYVRDSTLTCGYHGWSFGPGEEPGAQCLATPAHPGLTPPAEATVPGFPVAEALGIIWVGAGPGDTRPPHAAAREPLAVYPVRSITVQAAAPALRAALETMQPPGTETAETSETDGLITFKGPAVTVLAAVQDCGDGGSTAHVVSTDASPAARRALALWAARVRDHLAAAVVP